VDVDCLVANIVHSRAGGSDAEVNVHLFAVLRDWKRTAIAAVFLLQFDVGFAHATEERDSVALTLGPLGCGR
jgi:hypothetical protein